MVDVILDSSVLIGIAQYSMKNKSCPRKTEKPLLEIRELMLDGKINVIVTQTVYKEIKRGKDHDNGLTQRFVNEFCETIIPTQYEKDKALCMADAYGNFPIDDKFAIVLAEDSTQKNYKDAFIVGEASVEQKMRKKRIPFITANLRDVCYIKRINEIKKRHGLPEIFICSIDRYMDAVYFAQREDEKSL